MAPLGRYLSISAVQEASDAESICAIFDRRLRSGKIFPAGVVGCAADRGTVTGRSDQKRKVKDLATLRAIISRISPPWQCAVHFDFRLPRPASNASVEEIQSLCESALPAALQLLDQVRVPIFQVNGFLSAHSLKALKSERHGSPSIIYRVTPPLRALGKEGLIKHLSERAGFFDVVLLDPSEGAGKTLPMAEAIAILEALRNALPAKNLAYSGGLTPENVGETLAALKDFNVSIDVESGVRDGAEDQINIHKVDRFVAAASPDLLASSS